MIFKSSSQKGKNAIHIIILLFMFVILRFVAVAPQTIIGLMTNDFEKKLSGPMIMVATLITVAILSSCIIFFVKVLHMKIDLTGLRISIFFKSYLFLMFILALGSILKMVINSGVNTDTANQLRIVDIQHSLPTPLFVFLLVVSGPILEELVYRFFIIGYAFKRIPVIGIVVSVVLFASIHHPENISSFISYSCPGIAFALIFYKTERIEYTILLHSFHNLCSVLIIIFL